MAKFRVIVQNVASADRAPGAMAAIIHDAKDIGASEQANGPGEFFMTLPMNHPHISAVVPLQTHYRVQRVNSAGSFETIFAGVVDDYEATSDEVVFYGVDYLGLLNTSLSGSNNSYPSSYIGVIVSDQLTAARVYTDSRVAFIGMGTIENTATTTIALTSYQPQLEFISQLADIAMADGTTRAIIQVSPRTSESPSFNFTANKGGDRENVRLEYGGLVNDFYYAPGYGTLATKVYAIGQKREGATVLYSAQSYAPSSTYGLIQRPALFTDIIDQTALDNKTKRAARAAGRVGKTLGLGIRSGALGPWEGYDIGDSVRVVIDRGIVQVNALYTVWGVEWIGKKNGSEELVLSLLPKDG